MSGWTTDLLTGLAEHLATAGIVRWQAEGAYPLDGLPPTFLRALGDAPDIAVALAAYSDPELEHVGLSHVVQAVQIRSRGDRDPTSADDLSDAIRDELHGAQRLTLGGVATSLIYRRSTTPLGVDAQGRYERVDNYYITAARPTGRLLD